MFGRVAVLNAFWTYKGFMRGNLIVNQGIAVTVNITVNCKNIKNSAPG